MPFTGYFPIGCRDIYHRTRKDEDNFKVLHAENKKSLVEVVQIGTVRDMKCMTMAMGNLLVRETNTLTQPRRKNSCDFAYQYI